MTSEEMVKELWPEARVKRWTWREKRRFRVVIKLGRISYGETMAEAWDNAWRAITQDDELSKGART